ncbi:pre-rRNA-processing protein FHL1-like [Harmonia axyridis]|uniref:pre-rRNA-processing protein FHL1-like n=1 Tax=Harmonia axyridis TaxID=115357 RepID=UPI001E277A0B|nr:pre-rRNA-processing protein FHL1-like [Harmonia axyridis]
MDICQFHSHSEESGNHQLQIINAVYIDDRNVNNIYEETSNCELRFISNEEMDDLLPPIGEYEELTTVKQLTTSCNNYCKLYKTFAESSINSPLENTDDQLFIEIVKEDIDARHNPDENKSILDSISFNIEDHEETVVKIKITNADNGFTMKDSSKIINWKTPELVPKLKNAPKEKSPRKPLQLANYCDLITDAINSSPEKRMILTEIYQYITEHVPFFKDIDKKGKEGWKNCVRHTLSVNKKFIRIKNTSKCRFSYWTVCEGGDFETQFAQYSWVSEIYKPEERKRKIINRKTMKLGQHSRNVVKSNKQVQNTNREAIEVKNSNNKKYSSRKRNTEYLRLDKVNETAKCKIAENQKPVKIKRKSRKGKVKNNKPKLLKHEIKTIKRTETKIKGTKKRKIKENKTPGKKYVSKMKKSIATDLMKKKQPTRILRVLPERLSRRAENVLQIKEHENIRRSSRKKTCRKSW